MNIFLEYITTEWCESTKYFASLKKYMTWIKQFLYSQLKPLHTYR